MGHWRTQAVYPQELRRRAVQMVAETRSEYESEFQAIRSVSNELGITSPETVRRWVRSAEVGTAGRRTIDKGGSSREVEELERQITELRRENEILKAASSYFAAELARLRDN
jgi:transposase